MPPDKQLHLVMDSLSSRGAFKLQLQAFQEEKSLAG